MKYFALFVMLVGLCVFTIGCEKPAATPPVDTTAPADDTTPADTTTPDDTTAPLDTTAPVDTTVPPADEPVAEPPITE